MSYIAFEFPILVQNIKLGEKPAYFLRPLFFNYPGASDRRFDKALTNFKKEIRHRLKGVQLSRDTLEELLWYKFNPKLEFKIFKMDFVAGKQYVSGKFAVSWFVLKEHCFVLLPAFNSHVFMAKKGHKGKYDIQGQVEDFIIDFVKRNKKEDGDDFDINEYTATKGEFITTAKVNVDIKNSKFPFQTSSLDFIFNKLSGSEDFEGSVEIEKVGYDMNELYPTELKRAFYRESLVDRIYNIIYQLDNSPIVIVGDEGVGKRSILHEVVYRYRTKNIKVQFERQERMWNIDPTRIISGMSIVGMWQKRFEAILKYVRVRRMEFGRATDKIVVDNIVAMLRIGKSSQNSMTLSDVLKPYLEKRLFQMILIATPEEWKVLQEKDRRFADLFQVIRVSEPDLETSVKMVAEQRKVLELEFGCQINSLAISQLFTIHRNYWKRKALPGSVVNFLRQLANKYKFGLIDSLEVRKEFEEISGLHQEIFDETYLFEKDEVYKTIAQNLVGQQEAVQCLSDVIHVIKAKMNDPDRPLGSFLFIGPTGVGKTQAAKVLCNYLMGSEDHLMRFDMNEYIDEYAVQRLIGDYHNPQGQLTGRVRYQPFGIILFDEIEKAHPKIHDLLLQVLDDGRLTDSLGRTVDFSNTVIIMTSNVGARDAGTKLGFTSSPQEESAIFKKAVERQFRPEFVNRINRIVIFNPLELDHILNIAQLQIKELLSRDGFVRRTTILNISPNALEWVARRGFNAKMGGRALKRQIERDLTTLSAEQLVATYSERPIIFEIILKDNRLYPKVTPLDFVEAINSDWLPSTPDENKGKRFYRNLLRELDHIEQSIPSAPTTMIYTGEMDSQTIISYNFRDRFGDLRELLKRRELGYGHDIIESNPVIPMRLKRVKFSSFIAKRDDYNNKGLREMHKDKFFQKEGLDELRDIYKYGQTHFDKAQSEYLNDFFSVEFLKLSSKGFRKKKIDKIDLQLESCITNMGKSEMEYLLEHYETFFENLELEFKVHKKWNKISIEGYGIQKLLAKEQGIHLFYVTHQTPLPIKLNLVPHSEEKTEEENWKVVRVYDGTNTLTDIRTGFTTDINITVNEFKLLIYAGQA